MAITALISAITGLAALLLGIKQLQHARQYDGAHQIAMGFSNYGTPTVISGMKEPIDEIEIQLHYRGFQPLYGVKMSLLWDNGEHWDLCPETQLQPGEKFGPKVLKIPCSDLDKVHLHVAWQTPHPAILKNKIRYQALRMNLAQEAQQWRWRPFEHLHRRRHSPLGKWKAIHNSPTDQQNFPGWPHGPAAKTIDW